MPHLTFSVGSLCVDGLSLWRDEFQFWNVWLCMGLQEETIDALDKQRQERD
jgi:hypothetical protein